MQFPKECTNPSGYRPRKLAGHMSSEPCQVAGSLSPLACLSSDEEVMQVEDVESCSYVTPRLSMTGIVDSGADITIVNGEVFEKVCLSQELLFTVSGDLAGVWLASIGTFSVGRLSLALCLQFTYFVTVVWKYQTFPQLSVCYWI